MRSAPVTKFARKSMVLTSATATQVMQPLQEENAKVTIYGQR